MKKINIITGHYGSGKTNLSVNLAMSLRAAGEEVTLVDLDIVNPYFRTKDSAKELESAGIELICSEYAGTNIDIPAMPQQMYMITDCKDKRFILDIGGDDRGALALGRLAPAIIKENDYVINCFRPLTRKAAEVIEVMREIEFAGGIKFTGLVNNSNLGEETTPEDVLSSLPYTDEVSRLSGLPIVCTTVHNTVYDALKGRINGLYSIKLQPKIN